MAVNNVGLTDLDIKIIEEMIEKFNMPKQNLNLKQVLFLFHEYKKVKNGVIDKEKRSRQTAFTKFVRYCLQRNLANFDTLILLTADKGTGKSSTAIQLARTWCKLIGIRFNPKRHMAYNNDDIMRLIKELKPFEPIVADEAIRFACLDGETLIDTEKGLIKIKYLEDKKDFKVKSYNEKTKSFEYKNAKKCIKTKIDYVYEIETECGKKIKATKDHMFLTNNGWKKVSELSEGDDINGL